MADEQMRKWIDIVSKYDEEGTVRSYIEFGVWWTKLIAFLVALSVILAGVEACRSFSCHVGWLTSVCIGG